MRGSEGSNYLSIRTHEGWRPAHTQVTKGLRLQRGLFQPPFPSLHLGEQSLQPRKEAGGPSTDLEGTEGLLAGSVSLL